MRCVRLAAFVSALSLAAACGTTAPVAVETRDIAIGSAQIDARDQVQGQAVAERRVTLTAKPTEADGAADGDRVVISAMRNALRSGNLDSYLRALSNASCPQGTPSRLGETIDLNTSPISVQSVSAAQRRIGGLTFVAAYELNSSDARLGGLSGVEVLDDGNLLAISDAGYFVWLDMDRDGLRPTAARISTMRGAGGQALTGVAGDSAEGLAVNGGMALVSFEGDHRVLAFDIGRCGASSRGAPIVFDDYGLALKDAYDEARISVGAADGSEPLAVTNDWYVFAGIERKVGHLNSLSARPIEAEPEFDLRVGVNAPEFAGIDLLPAQKGDGAVRAFLLHRAPADAKSGVWITETNLLRYESTQVHGPVRGEMDARARQRYSETGWREVAQLEQFGILDSFEGIAAKQLSDGRVRLYLVSDDDFSADKRTVLMIMDAPRPLR